MNHFQKNLSCLWAEDASFAAAIREAGGGVLDVTESRQGVPTAMQSGRQVHSAYDPIAEADAWADSQAALWQPGEVAVVLGVGLLYHAESLRRRHHDGDDAMVVVVPDLRELHDACRARTLDSSLRNVLWVRGTPEEIARVLSGLGRPLRFVSYAPAARLHAEFHGDLDAAMRQASAAQAGGRMHIALVGPIYGGSLPVARYAVAALEQLGHRVSWIDQSPHYTSYEAMAGVRNARNRLTLQSTFADLLSRFTLARVADDPPDLVLALAQAPMTLPVLDQLRRKKFLTVMWFVENYRHLTYWQQVAGGYDYWFVIQQHGCRDALRWAGAKEIHYLPMAAAPAVHRPMSLTDGERGEFGSDVSFVGAGYANRRALLQGLVRPEWSFKLWGNEWEGADALRSVLQREGARIDTETCMKVFNATAVNINLHSYTGNGLDPQADFVNPRTFELAACKAFQVVDQRSLLSELFGAEQIAVFRQGDELPTCVRTWLHDAGARTAMAQAAYERTLAEHTYVHRMESLLAQVGLGHPDRVGAILRGERQVERLAGRSQDCPELIPLLRRSTSPARVELKDLAAEIRAKGPTAALNREELMILMLDEYRAETRDIL